MLAQLRSGHSNLLRAYRHVIDPLVTRHAQSVVKAISWNTDSPNVLHWQLPGYIFLGLQMYLRTSSLSLSLCRTSQVRHAGKEVSLRLLWRVCQQTTTLTTLSFVLMLRDLHR